MSARFNFPYFRSPLRTWFSFPYFRSALWVRCRFLYFRSALCTLCRCLYFRSALCTLCRCLYFRSALCTLCRCLYFRSDLLTRCRFRHRKPIFSVPDAAFFYFQVGTVLQCLVFLPTVTSVQLLFLLYSAVLTLPSGATASFKC
jgi:hypothetical protein